jgi:putative addiction module component (TIGR02574 family)
LSYARSRYPRGQRRVHRYDPDMSSTLDTILHAALMLSDQERARLAARLLDSLDPRGDDDVDAAWDAEVARRLAALDSGTAKVVPWRSVREELQAVVDSSVE